MNVNFRIRSRKSNGNLHIRPEGDFDGSTACELIDFIHREYKGKGDVYIDTHALKKIYDFGCEVFCCRLKHFLLPKSRLFFEGEKGVEIASRGGWAVIDSGGQRAAADADCRKCPLRGFRKNR